MCDVFAHEGVILTGRRVTHVCSRQHRSSRSVAIGTQCLQTHHSGVVGVLAGDSFILWTSSHASNSIDGWCSRMAAMMRRKPASSSCLTVSCGTVTCIMYAYGYLHIYQWLHVCVSCTNARFYLAFNFTYHCYWGGIISNPVVNFVLVLTQITNFYTFPGQDGVK